MKSSTLSPGSNKINVMPRPKLPLIKNLVENIKKRESTAKPQPPPEKINSEHLSFIVYEPAVQNAPSEYFLALTQDGSLTFLGLQLKNQDDPWKGAIDDFFREAGMPSTKTEGLIRMEKWYAPGSERLSTHSVHVIPVVHEQKAIISQTFPGMWVTLGRMTYLLIEKKLASPELLEITSRFESKTVPLLQVNEITEENIFLGVDRSTDNRPVSGYEQTLQSASFGREEQEEIYKEFMNATLPFFFMGWRPFCNYMRTLGFQENTFNDLFRSMDIQGKNGIGYRDFLYGLASMEKTTAHGGSPAEIRCRFIFRYYDTDADGKLTFEDLKRMLMDIIHIRSVPPTTRELQLEIESNMRAFGETPRFVEMNEFLIAVGQLKFRGTSVLFRAPVSILQMLQSKMFENKRVQKKPKSLAHASNASNETLPFNSMKITKVSSYDIAAHSVRVRRSGTIMDVHALEEIEHSGLFGGKAPTSRVFVGNGANRIQSNVIFNQESEPNEMINGLKYFEKAIKNEGGTGVDKPPFEWGIVDRNSLAKCLIGLCQKNIEILSKEPRLVELSSPVYILGDLHGNFPDLLSFEKALWRLGPALTPATFLFLGDYVDRGSMGVEVIAYLFAHKILTPHKFVVLRGNHEIRSVQEMFTFLKECITKFGEKVGREVWEAVNNAFDCMPLAATIDKKVFCVHGGIPPPWMGNGMIEYINRIPCPLRNPEVQSQLSWELMWSDPLHENLSPEVIANLKFESNGFANNTKRGTAHVFTADALDSFLTRNKLSHVIRAHEVQQAGFQVQLKGKLMTVFSSSRYCGGSNEAACILADKLKLRSIRIDTSI